MEKKIKNKFIISILLHVIFIQGNNALSQNYDNYRLYYRPQKNDCLDSIPFLQAAFENCLFSYEHYADSVEYTSFKISGDTLFLTYFPYSNSYINVRESNFFFLIERSEENENILFLVYEYRNGTNRKLKYRIVR